MTKAIKGRIMVKNNGKRFSCKEWVTLTSNYSNEVLSLSSVIHNKYDDFDNIKIDICSYERGCEWVKFDSYTIK